MLEACEDCIPGGPAGQGSARSRRLSLSRRRRVDPDSPSAISEGAPGRCVGSVFNHRKGNGARARGESFKVNIVMGGTMPCLPLPECPGQFTGPEIGAGSTFDEGRTPASTDRPSKGSAMCGSRPSKRTQRVHDVKGGQ